MLVRLTLADGRGLMPDVLANRPGFQEAWFIVAGPPTPGILPTTSPARILCGFKAAGGPDLVPLPALSFMRRWPSDAHQPPCPNCDGTAYPLGEGPPLRTR